MGSFVDPCSEWSGIVGSVAFLFFKKLAVLVLAVFLLSFETKCQTCLM